MRDFYHRLLGMAVLTALGFVGGGCSQSDSSAPVNPQPVIATSPDQPVPADSPFSKVKKNMSQDEVFSMIGEPNSTNQYITRKSFLRITFGSEKYGMEAHYKGQGRIIFSPQSSDNNRMAVAEIHYDPSESGYAP